MIPEITVRIENNMACSGEYYNVGLTGYPQIVPQSYSFRLTSETGSDCCTGYYYSGSGNQYPYGCYPSISSVSIISGFFTSYSESIAESGNYAVYTVDVTYVPDFIGPGTIRLRSNGYLQCGATGVYGESNSGALIQWVPAPGSSCNEQMIENVFIVVS